MTWKIAFVAHWFLLAPYVSFSTVLARSKHKIYSVSDGNIRGLEESRSHKGAFTHLRSVLNAKKSRKHSFRNKGLINSPNNFLPLAYSHGQRLLDSQESASPPCRQINSPNIDLLHLNGLEHVQLNTQREGSSIKSENNLLTRSFRPAKVRLRSLRRAQRKNSPNEDLPQPFGAEHGNLNLLEQASVSFPRINSENNDFHHTYGFGPEPLQINSQQRASLINFPNKHLQQPYGLEQVQVNTEQGPSGPFPQIKYRNNDLPYLYENGPEQVQVNSGHGASDPFPNINFPNNDLIHPHNVPGQVRVNSREGASTINFPNSHLLRPYGPEQVQVNSEQGELGSFPRINSPNFEVSHQHGTEQGQLNSRQGASGPFPQTNSPSNDVPHPYGLGQEQLNFQPSASEQFLQILNPLLNGSPQGNGPEQVQLSSGQGASGLFPQINSPNNDVRHPYGLGQGQLNLQPSASEEFLQLLNPLLNGLPQGNRPEQVQLSSGQGASGPFPQIGSPNDEVYHSHGPGQGQLNIQPSASEQFLQLLNPLLNGLPQGNRPEQGQLNSGQGASGPFPQINSPSNDDPHPYGLGQGQLNFQPSASNQFLQLLNPQLKSLLQAYGPKQVQVNSGRRASGPFPQISSPNNDFPRPGGPEVVQHRFPLSNSDLLQLLNSIYTGSPHQDGVQQGQLNTPQSFLPFHLLCQILFKALSSCLRGDSCSSSGVTTSLNWGPDSMSRSAPKGVDSSTVVAKESSAAKAESTRAQEPSPGIAASQVMAVAQKEVVAAGNVPPNVSPTVQTLPPAILGTKPSSNNPEQSNTGMAAAPTKVTATSSGGAYKTDSESATPVTGATKSVLVSLSSSLSNIGPLPTILGSRMLED